MKKVINPAEFLYKLESSVARLATGKRANEFLHLTKHDGKLEGLQSLSTVSYCNPLCLARMKKEDSVCAHCYVANYNFRKSLMAHLVLNFRRLTTSIVSVDLLPVFYSVYGRIESFGDVYNVEQAINYIHTMEKNPSVRFGAWSKNVAIWAKAFKAAGKPANCSFILSSFGLNSPAVVPERYADIVDAVFTVYSLDYVKAHDVPIHCGFSRCLVCGKCYNAADSKHKSGKIVYVNEILKEDAAAYLAWINAGKPAA